MGWVTPPDWATTSGISLGSLNTYLRDNMLSLRNNNDWLVKCSKTANQSVPATAYTPISFNVHDILVGTTALHSTASGTKFHAPVAGQYRLLGTEVFVSSSGWVGAAYRLNGVSPDFDISADMAETPELREILFVDTITMTTADYLEVLAWVERASSGTINGGAPLDTRVTWQLIGAAT